MYENVKNFKNVMSINFSDLFFMTLFLLGIIICSQIVIPLPTGVPFTLQTLSIALLGFSLGPKKGTYTIISYVLLGTIGLPVFSNFTSGISSILGLTGGFILGFIPMVFLCGFSNRFENKSIKAILILLGLIVCHMFGVIQYSMLTSLDFISSFMLVSAPFIIKDIISLVLAFFMSKKIAVK